MHHQQFVIKTKAWRMLKKGIQITEAVHLEIDPAQEKFPAFAIGFSFHNCPLLEVDKLRMFVISF